MENIAKSSMQNMIAKFKAFSKTTLREFVESLKKISIDSIGWTAMAALHAVTIPTLLGLMTGLTDITPPIDMVIILWAALGLFYVKSILQKDIMNIIIIGTGFIGQSVLMALVFFK